MGEAGAGYGRSLHGSGNQAGMRRGASEPKGRPRNGSGGAPLGPTTARVYRQSARVSLIPPLSHLGVAMTISVPPGKEPRERGKGPLRELRRCLPMIRRSLRAIARVIPVDARGSAAIEGLGGGAPDRLIAWAKAPRPAQGGLRRPPAHGGSRACSIGEGAQRYERIMVRQHPTP